MILSAVLCNQIQIMAYHMKSIAGILIVFTASLYLLSLKQEDDPFEMWKIKHSITFSSLSEEIYRRHIFIRNKKLVQEHNSNPLSTYEMELNQFAIYSQQEFISRFLMNSAPQQTELQSDDIRAVIVDWTAQGAVTPVKNQGQCGSVTAFAQIAGCQGLSKIAYGALVSFSQQQIVDCQGHGCNGGSIGGAYAYIKAHGISPTVDYPYTGRVGTCKTTTGSFKISDYKTVKTCDQLVEAVKKQPVTVVVDASNWQLYRSGIFSNCKNQLNHEGLLTALADQYWKVKNSWGSAWGESGYIRLARGDTCGICQNAMFPVK